MVLNMYGPKGGPFNHIQRMQSVLQKYHTKSEDTLLYGDAVTTGILNEMLFIQDQFVVVEDVIVEREPTASAIKGYSVFPYTPKFTSPEIFTPIYSFQVATIRGYDERIFRFCSGNDIDASPYIDVSDVEAICTTVLLNFAHLKSQFPRSLYGPSTYPGSNLDIQ